MAIGFNFDFGSERRQQRALDLAKKERKQISEEARQRDVAALTAAGQPEPFSPLADPNSRQAELGATVAQASPAAQDMLAQQQAALQPPTAQERAALRKEQAQAINAELDTINKLQGNDIQAIGLANQRMTGGLSLETYYANKEQIRSYGRAQQQVRDLAVMDTKLGKKILPSGARGTYNAKRNFIANSVRELFEAGDMSKEQQKFILGMLPEWEIFSNFSQDERLATLRELEAEFSAKQGFKLESTPNVTAREIVDRPLDTIMGVPAPEDQGFEGFEEVEPELTIDNLKDRIEQDFPGTGEFLDRVKGAFNPSRFGE